MSNFVGQTVHATNQTTGSQEQAEVMEVFDDGRVRVRFVDGTLAVLTSNEMVSG